MKFIIDNRTDLTDLQVFDLIVEVVRLGRVKYGKEYLYKGDGMIDGTSYYVYSEFNKNSEKFIIKELH